MNVEPISRRCMQHAFTGVVAVAAAALLGGTAALADTCSPTPQSGCGTPFCTNGNFFAGGVQQQTSSPWPQVFTGYITTFNPYPVWSSSNAWIALENRDILGGPGWISQMGYDHTWGLANGNIVVFIEYSRDDGSQNTIYKDVLSQSQSISYKVKRDFTGGGAAYGYSFFWTIPGQSQKEFDTSSVENNPITWGPDSIEGDGEVLDYDSGRNTGSHVVGNQSRLAQWTQLVFFDQNNNGYVAALNQWFGGNETYGPSASYQYVSPNGGAAFSVWDTRCHD